MLDQLFELFAAHGALAVLFLDPRVFGIHAVQREIGGAGEHHFAVRALAGNFRLVELAADVPGDLFGLVLVGLDLAHELVVQGQDAEPEAVAAGGVVFAEVADLDARAADVDQHGALPVMAVGDVAAVGLRFGVDKVDGHARVPEDGGVHFFKVFNGAKGRRGDEEENVRPEADAFVFHDRNGVGQLLDAAAGQAAPVEVVHQRQAGAVAKDDLFFAADDVRHQERDAAGTDVDDGKFHVALLISMPRGARRVLAKSAPCRPSGRKSEERIAVFLFQRPKQTPMPSAARTISLSGSTSLYLPAMSARALKVISPRETATVTPKRPCRASMPA